MALLREAARGDKEKELMAYRSQALHAINKLKAIKANLVTFKNTVNGSDECDAEDVADVQKIIDEIVIEIASI